MSINIVITGDYCPIGRNLSSIKKGESDSLFGDFLPYATAADLAITNIECPLTDYSKKIKKTGPNHKVPPIAITPIRNAGFKLVTLANNHIMDYGSEGLLETMKICKQEGIDYVGVGKNLEEARKPYFIKIKEKTFAILNITENEFSTTLGNAYGANPLNLITNHYDIKEAKKTADYVIVISHGGREHYQLPSPKLRERYRFFIDSGADVVVGHHSHCFSGFEKYNDKTIFYSLGNFLFDSKKRYENGMWTQGFGVSLNFTNTDVNFELIPYNQGRKENHRISLLNEEERKVFNQKIAELNKIIIDDQLLIKEWDAFLKQYERPYKVLLFFQNTYLRSIIKKLRIPGSFLHTKIHSMLLLNMMRCETHREIMIDILKRDFNRI